MGLNQPFSKDLALEPVEVATPGGDATRMGAGETKANPERDLRMTTVDEFLAAAAKEYEAGKIDQVAWRQAADQCRGDASLAIAAYLRARATALQLRRKADDSTEMKLRGAGSMSRAAEGQAQNDPRAELASTRLQEVAPARARPKMLYVAGAAVALASAAAVVYLVVSLGQGDSARQGAASAGTPASQPARAVPRGNQALAAGPNASDPKSTLAATVAQLKSTGNWNVLVLYASEWTRKEPGNAVAWSELSVGYAQLRQYNEALDAAAKAVQLAPGDSATWRNLGQLNLAVDRLPEAGAAFDKALALNPDEADARCGAALVAQRQARPKDPDAIVRRPISTGSSCADLGSAETATSSVGIPVAGRPASSAGR
jgi:tetratricopeptide (TPR) repeat protein